MYVTHGELVMEAGIRLEIKPQLLIPLSVMGLVMTLVTEPVMASVM